MMGHPVPVPRGRRGCHPIVGELTGGSGRSSSRHNDVRTPTQNIFLTEFQCNEQRISIFHFQDTDCNIGQICAFRVHGGASRGGGGTLYSHNITFFFPLIISRHCSNFHWTSIYFYAQRRHKKTKFSLLSFLSKTFMHSFQFHEIYLNFTLDYDRLKYTMSRQK